MIGQTHGGIDIGHTVDQDRTGTTILEIAGIEIGVTQGVEHTVDGSAIVGATPEEAVVACRKGMDSGRLSAARVGVGLAGDPAPTIVNAPTAALFGVQFVDKILFIGILFVDNALTGLAL